MLVQRDCSTQNSRSPFAAGSGDRFSKVHSVHETSAASGLTMCLTRKPRAFSPALARNGISQATPPTSATRQKCRRRIALSPHRDVAAKLARICNSIRTFSRDPQVKTVGEAYSSTDRPHSARECCDSNPLQILGAAGNVDLRSTDANNARTRVAMRKGQWGSLRRPQLLAPRPGRNGRTINTRRLAPVRRGKTTWRVESAKKARDSAGNVNRSVRVC